jgi:hypothetical protein
MTVLSPLPACYCYCCKFVGHDQTPKTVASRLVYLTTYLIALLLFVAYSATFISFLTVRRNDMPFNDFSGLLEDGTYNLGVLSGSARVDFFKVMLVTAEL